MVGEEQIVGDFAGTFNKSEERRRMSNWQTHKQEQRRVWGSNEKLGPHVDCLQVLHVFHLQIA